MIREYLVHLKGFLIFIYIVTQAIIYMLCWAGVIVRIRENDFEIGDIAWILLNLLGFAGVAVYVLTL